MPPPSLLPDIIGVCACECSASSLQLTTSTLILLKGGIAVHLKPLAWGEGKGRGLHAALLEGDIVFEEFCRSGIRCAGRE
jgi:hypothetical protein